MNNYHKIYIEYLEKIKQYSPETIKTYNHAIDVFILFFKSNNINDIQDLDYSLVRGYIIFLNNEGLSNSSIRLNISVMRSFYRYLISNDIVRNNPFDLVLQPKVAKRNPDFLYVDEFEMLVDSIDDNTILGARNKMVLELMYATGVRVSELVNIKINDIDFDTRVIRVLGKGNKYRIVPFNPICEQYLKEYINDIRNEFGLIDHDYLLVNKFGNKITSRGVYDICERVAKNSMLNKRIHPHMFRHTFATHVLDNGADIRVVQEMLGHANLNSTEIYTHVTMDKLKKTYMKAHPFAKKK